jgi:hypothetical protein
VHSIAFLGLPSSAIMENLINRNVIAVSTLQTEKFTVQHKLATKEIFLTFAPWILQRFQHRLLRTGTSNKDVIRTYLIDVETDTKRTCSQVVTERSELKVQIHKRKL